MKDNEQIINLLSSICDKLDVIDERLSDIELKTNYTEGNTGNLDDKLDDIIRILRNK